MAFSDNFFQQTLEQWQYVFFITAGMLIISGLIYVFFSDSTLQSWNDDGNSTKTNELQIVMTEKDKPQNDHDKYQAVPKNEDSLWLSQRHKWELVGNTIVLVGIFGCDSVRIHLE